MMNKIIALVVSFGLAFPAPIFAQDTEPMYTHLQAGEEAPFAGTLFNPPALSELIVDSQFTMYECYIRVEFEKSRCSAYYQLQ